MDQDQPLRGSCSCGRNLYDIVIPSNASNVARVLFHDGSDQRKPSCFRKEPRAVEARASMAYSLPEVPPSRPG